jgi:hypothetical protein
MNMVNTQAAVTARIDDMVALYSSPAACAATLLCDGRDRAALAYRVIAADLSARDISYGKLRQELERFAAIIWSPCWRSGVWARCMSRSLPPLRRL